MNISLNDLKNSCVQEAEVIDVGALTSNLISIRYDGVDYNNIEVDFQTDCGTRAATMWPWKEGAQVHKYGTFGGVNAVKPTCYILLWTNPEDPLDNNVLGVLGVKGTGRETYTLQDAIIAPTFKFFIGIQELYYVSGAPRRKFSLYDLETDSIASVPNSTNTGFISAQTSVGDIPSINPVYAIQQGTDADFGYLFDCGMYRLYGMGYAYNEVSSGLECYDGLNCPPYSTDCLSCEDGNLYFCNQLKVSA